MNEINVTITRVARKYRRADGAGYWGITGTSPLGKVWFASGKEKVSEGTVVTVTYKDTTAKPGITFLNKAKSDLTDHRAEIQARILRELEEVTCPDCGQDCGGNCAEERLAEIECGETPPAGLTVGSLAGRIRDHRGTPAEAARGVGMLDCELEPTPEERPKRMGTFTSYNTGEKETLEIRAGATIVFKQGVTVEEAELLRAVSDSLDCPVPPFLPAQAAA